MAQLWPGQCSTRCGEFGAWRLVETRPMTRSLPEGRRGWGITRLPLGVGEGRRMPGASSSSWGGRSPCSRVRAGQSRPRSPGPSSRRTCCVPCWLPGCRPDAVRPVVHQSDQASDDEALLEGQRARGNRREAASSPRPGRAGQLPGCWSPSCSPSGGCTVHLEVHQGGGLEEVGRPAIALMQARAEHLAAPVTTWPARVCGGRCRRLGAGDVGAGLLVGDAAVAELGGVDRAVGPGACCPSPPTILAPITPAVAAWRPSRAVREVGGFHRAGREL